MTASSALLETPLHAAHARLGARLVDFAGWDMPIQYPTGILAEHDAVRRGCGLFDLSHMGRVFVRGPGALALSQFCTTRDLAAVRDGEAAYCLLCAPDGGILDDVIAYRLGAEEVLFVFNASNRESDAAHFLAQKATRGDRADIVDETLRTALIGVQGPAAQRVLQSVCSADLERMPGYSFLHFLQAEVAGHAALVSRTGYTGEDGFEIMVAAEDAEATWHGLLSGPGEPIACGLGARDTLRTEAAMALYGHEIDRGSSPFEARLGWVVNLGKGDFVGREALQALKERGPTRKLVGLRLAAGGVPRPGHGVTHDGEPVGRVTSGTFSPSLKASIALAYVPVPLSGIGQSLSVELRGRGVPAEVVRLPFVPHRTRPRAAA